MAADLSCSDKEIITTTLQSIQRDINSLSEENKATRKKAIDNISKALLKNKHTKQSKVLQEILNEILKPVLKLFSDPSEKCRELSIQFILDMCSEVVDVSSFLPYLIPTCVQRLAQQDIVEHCEELRLLILQLLTTIIEHCQQKMSVYIDDLIKILQMTIADPFHQVKKESCKCTCILAKTIPEQFYYQADALVKPLVISLTHQHSKVRLAVLETIGVVIQGGDGKNIDSVLSHIAQRTFDDNPSVRSMVSTVIATWLLHLTDRYSYFHKLIPLLITGFSDEIIEIQEKSRRLFNQVGEQYEKENEEELKDKQNFTMSEHFHKDFKGHARPCLGCRILVERNFSKILPAILRDITDWTVSTRIKASSLLFHMLYFAEDNTTQHMESLLTGLYKACKDEENDVVKYVTSSGELIGYYVQPEVYLKLCIPHLKSASSSSPIQCACVLRILASLIRGTSNEKITPYFKKICDSLVEPDVCDTVVRENQSQLLNAVEEILSKSRGNCKEHGLQLFVILQHILALQHEDMFNERIDKCWSNLSYHLQLQTTEDLYTLYTKDFLEQLKKSHETWTSHSSSFTIFTTLLIHAGQVIGSLLQDFITPMMINCLNVEKDAELRLKFFSLLSKLSMNSSTTINSTGLFPQYSSSIVVHCILPNLVWKAGKVAMAIRTAAISTLWSLLHSHLISVEKCNEILKDLLLQILTCLDDHSKTTRLISCQVLEKLLTLCKDTFEIDSLHSLYPELLKRMDDSHDEIRVFVTKTFLTYLKSFPASYDKDLYKLHLEAIFKGLLVHLDDSSHNIQEGVLSALKEASDISPAILKEQILLVQHKHRVSRYCNELLQHIENNH